MKQWYALYVLLCSSVIWKLPHKFTHVGQFVAHFKVAGNGIVSINTLTNLADILRLTFLENKSWEEKVSIFSVVCY